MTSRSRLALATLALSIIPALASAQSPLADALREHSKTMGKNLVAGAETMPADKYSYKPTPAQMSFGDIVKHLAGGNDLLCGAIGGMKAPARAKLDPAADKATLVARLKESFAFCDQAFAKLDDSKLSEQFKLFGETFSRAAAEMEAVGDWSDHYSQMANYLRLNGHLPPTAKK
ncbi:MAG: DinB family protein [Gemmatimonadaceae bacterium]